MSPAKAEYNRRYMRTRRYVSKLAGRCPCGAGLQEDDGNYCVDCASRPRTWTAKDNARKAAERLARINRGECAYCNAPATCGTLCKGHRQKQTAAQRRYLAKRRAGIVSISSARRARTVEVTNTQERLLRSLSRWDWVSSRELFEAMGVEEGRESRERNAWAQLLARSVKRGHAEFRGTRGARDYRITPAGRALIAERLRRVA
mgnify:CR=1 FL=1|jgi:hypothetical protein